MKVPVTKKVYGSKVKIQMLNVTIGIQTDTWYYLKCQMRRRKQIKS